MVDGGAGLRAVARAYLVLGLAAAYFALFALLLDPATYRQLQLQMAKDSNQQQLEQGCAPTAAEVMKMRADAVVLLMLGAAEAMLGKASAAATSLAGTVCAQFLSSQMAWNLRDVMDGVVHVAIGCCHGSYHQALVAGHSIISVSITLLYVAGLVVILSGQNTAAADVTHGKPAPASSGVTTTGSARSPSPKQGKIKHGAASTSQAPPPCPLGAQGLPGSSRAQGQTAALPPSPASTRQQHLQNQSLPQLQYPAYMVQYTQPAAPPQHQPQPLHDVHGFHQYTQPPAPAQHQPQPLHDVHGFHQAALTGALQNMSLSLQGSGTGWVAGSTSDHYCSMKGYHTKQEQLRWRGNSSGDCYQIIPPDSPVATTVND